VRGWHQSYFLAVPAGIAVALATGALIDLVVVRRFFNAPRLILTVATIGLMQILGAAEIRIPTLVSENLKAIDTFATPFHTHCALGGPVVLLAPLAAAVIARMESLPMAVVAALGIGVFQQAVFWNYPRSSTVDVGLFAIILVALLLQRRRVSRVDDAGLGGYV